MGRKIVEHPELTAVEKKRARDLMKKYAWLPKDVVVKNWRRKYSSIPLDDAISIANMALCEIALDYVRLERERSRKLLGYDEKAYLARSIENALRDYMRAEGARLRAKRRAEEVLLQEEQENLLFEEQRDQSNLVRRIDTFEQAFPLVRFREFAKTLMPEEQAVFEEGLQDTETGQGRTFAEIAKARGICRTNLYRTRLSIAKKLLDWLDEAA